jgi:small subunit ribosomal protein S9
MTDEPQGNETSEGEENLAQDEGGQPAGPGVDEGPSSSRDDAAGEDPSSTPPAAETDQSDQGPDAEAEEPAADASEEAVRDEAEAEEPAEASAAEQEVEEPKAEKKKDLIPGADLEPIAVEPEERPLSAEEQARREAEEEERRQREAALVGEAEEELQAASRAPAKLEGDSRFLATGKRKHAIARVTLLPGNGKIEINKRPLEEFFPRPLHQTTVKLPLATTGYEGNVDVRVRVHGGGVSGQAGAVRHGIARALTEVDPELRGELKRRGFLTRDARVKERRKAGLKKARKRPQFSKR